MILPSPRCSGRPVARATTTVTALLMLLTAVAAGCIADDQGQSEGPFETGQTGQTTSDGALAGAPVEPDIAMADPGVAEDGAEPAPFDERGLDSADGSAPAEQRKLGPTEAVVCLGVEVALDELADGAITDHVADQRRDLLERRTSDAAGADGRLLTALRPSRSGDEAPGAPLARAMDRCQQLGYQR